MGNTAQPDIRRIWGIAKSPELKLSDEELHLLVEAHTGKDSIRELNRRECQVVIRVLLGLKDSAKKTARRSGGTTATENQRKKIYRLAQELGWDRPARVNGMCRRMFKVSLPGKGCLPGRRGLDGKQAPGGNQRTDCKYTEGGWHGLDVWGTGLLEGRYRENG